MNAAAPYVARLIATDRCDECSARARVRTVQGTLVLDWCRHHFEARADALAAHEFTVEIDDRAQDERR